MGLAEQLPEEVRAEIEALLVRGRKIEAVKRLREATGVGLADAMAAIEEMAARVSSETGGKPIGPRGGCALVLALTAIPGAAALWIFV